MALNLREEQGIRLAIEGCGHGTLHAIYASIDEACSRKGWPDVDLLIIGGDFQSVRNAYDLNCVNMPAKYRSMCDFHEYYSGQRKAPYLTIFVGGNHEASNYLFELYYGGWVAPNIYYMGAANVLRLGPLRIAGLSGIWKGYNYRKAHFERLPYNESDMRSVYHVRELDVRKVLQIGTQVDVGISHDWPKGVEWKGNFKRLFRYKKHLEEDARNGQLGSVGAQQVMDLLRPRYWFSAHLHCKYAALIQYDGGSNEPPSSSKPVNGDNNIGSEDQVGSVYAGNGEPTTRNEDEIDLDLDDMNFEGATREHSQGGINGRALPLNTDEIDLEFENDADGAAPVAPGQGLEGVELPTSTDALVEGPTLTADDARAALPPSFSRIAKPEPLEHPSQITNTTTQFLALDKCLPNKHFLQLMSVPTDSDLDPRRPLKLEYDREWLAITRAFALHEPPTLGDPDARPPAAKSQAQYKVQIEEQMEWLTQNLADGELEVPSNFEPLAPVYDGGNWELPQYARIEEYPNPQTARFCSMLQIPNAFDITAEERMARLTAGPRPGPENERPRAGVRGRDGFRRGGGRGGFGRGRGRGGNRGRVTER